jgi:serine/threonine-protein kinase HipA
MALGEKNHYRLQQIQLRHFYQTGQKAGLSKQDIEGIFTDLVTRTENALSEAANLAADAGMPDSTYGSILDGVSKRVGMIG